MGQSASIYLANGGRQFLAPPRPSYLKGNGTNYKRNLTQVTITKRGPQDDDL